MHQVVIDTNRNIENYIGRNLLDGNQGHNGLKVWTWVMVNRGGRQRQQVFITRDWNWQVPLYKPDCNTTLTILFTLLKITSRRLSSIPTINHLNSLLYSFTNTSTTFQYLIIWIIILNMLRKYFSIFRKPKKIWILFWGSRIS